jgi:hypothetical protein
METDKVTDISNQLNKLTYENKRDVYQRSFSLGYLNSEEMNDRLILISLVALVYQKMKLKEKDITPLIVLVKITGEKEENSVYYQFLEALAIIVEDFSYGIKKIDACGFKSSPEIINKIKEILNTWIPF